MKFFRLSRFKRSHSLPRLDLTERDQNILRLVYRHRFVRSSQVIALVGGSSQQLLRRLQKLYHHGFLERPRAQIAYYYRGGNRSLVYGLGNKGGTLMKREFPGAASKISWGEKNRSVGGVFLEHALLVSDVMVAIELVCREIERVRFVPQDELIRNEGKEPQTFRWSVNLPGGVRLGLIPDRVFALEFSNQVGEIDRAYFFLEADRGTMPVRRGKLSQTSFYRKLLAYEATWSQSLHRKNFGFHRFRVLTVTTSAARVNSLVEACSDLKSGHGLFLFTDRTILENPGFLFSPLWKTGRKGEPISLLL